MPVCPFATRRLIPASSSDPRITPRVAILHVDAGNADSLYDYFAHRSGGIESHFHVQRGGGIEQYRDTDFQADANLNANDFAVSIETQGYGEGEWTPEQIASIKRLLLWLHEVHGIPLRKCPGPYDAGVGHHTLFGAPGPWTPVAKSCPGPDRKRQFDNVLVPWMNSGAPSQEDTDMPLNDDDLKRIANHVWSDEMGGKGNRHSARHHLIRAANASMDNRRLLQTVPDQIADAVAADVQNDLDAGGGIEPRELRRIVRVQATRAMTELLGALDEPAG